MRKVFLYFVVLVVFVLSVHIQNTGTAWGQAEPVVIYPDASAESVALADISPAKPQTDWPPVNALNSLTGESEVTEIPMLPLPRDGTSGLSGDGGQITGSLQGIMEGSPLNAPVVVNAMPATSLSFDGLSSQDNVTAGFPQLAPPDPNGDVGPNHYVQMTNLLVRVFDKAGNPLTAPFKLSSLFAPLGGQCAVNDYGDPIVLYDPLADRWLLSQFAFANLTAPPYHECIAISQTNDPTGTYYLYDFITPGIEFPNYPKLGVWPDAYYMTTIQYRPPALNFDGTGAFAFERAKMLVGDPTASLIYFNLNLASHPEGIGGVLPSDFDGLIAPPTGRPNTFAYFIATEFGDSIDGLRLFDFHADFADPANSTFTERTESPIPVAAFNPLSPIGIDDILQPPPAPPTAALDSFPNNLMHRLQYRTDGTNEWLVTNHTVNVSGSLVLGAYRTGVRYYQLQSTGSAFSILEQATFDPVDGNSRWMGSAAIDWQGNLAVGYSVSSIATFPSIRYAGRLASDPPGGLFQGEATLMAGTGVQTSTISRWGDYTALTVDPADDCTFWYTNEYYTAASQALSSVGWLTRIASFKFPSCTSLPQGTLQGTVTDSSTSDPISDVLVQVSSFTRVTDAAGFYSMNLASGNHTVTVSKYGYTSASATVTVTNGGVTIQDFSLTPVPIMVSDSAALITESFPPNGAIDPGETVEVDFTLKNIGPADTINLVATLLPIGGVTGPSGPESYGVITGAGGTGTQRFTFTADPNLPCGNTLTATLHLEDGALDLGDVSFTFVLGAKVVIFLENFDAVTAPALPAGWTATVSGGLSTNNWRTVTDTPDTPPNVAFVPDPDTVHDVLLDSPVFVLGFSGSQLSFRNYYNMEAGFDGGVLEISINGSPFADILTVGGSFESGGYNRTLSASTGGALAGRQAWSDNSGGYIDTVVNLPAAAVGQNVQLRWRMGSDTSVSDVGWRVDTIQVYAIQCAVAADAQIAIVKVTEDSVTSGDGLNILTGESIGWTYTVTNVGNVPLSNVTVTDSQGVAVSCPKTTLAVAENMVCTASSTAISGNYSNTGTASGSYTDSSSQTLTDTETDDSSYFGASPQIDIDKKTVGSDGSEGDNVFVLFGGTVTWNYYVTNTGNVTLSDVTVTDNQGGTVTCPKTTLVVGESMTCTVTGTNTAPAGTSYNNTGTATGSYTDSAGHSSTVTGSDTSGYFSHVPGMVTNSSLCDFGNDFTLVFTPDIKYYTSSLPAYKLSGSNPGQFFYNVFQTDGTGTVTLTLPYPFVTQGATPIHVYSGLTTYTSNGMTCLQPTGEIKNYNTQVTLSSYPANNYAGTTTVTLTDLPTSGFLYINIHLDYGLEKLNGWVKNGANANYNLAINPTMPHVNIINNTQHSFTSSIPNSTDSVYNNNEFKNVKGFGGLAMIRTGTVDGVDQYEGLQGATVQLWKGTRLIETMTTDVNGWYLSNYVHSGKEATYTSKVLANTGKVAGITYSYPTQTNSVTVGKSLKLGVVNFQILP